MKQARRTSSQPPDGGWGWVVLMAAFMNAVITQGLIKSGGIIYTAFPLVIEMTKTQAAIISTISEAMMRFMGPVAGSLAQRFSYKSVVFVGGLVASVGLISSFFATNYILVLITFGILFGVGSSFILVPGDIITGLYFEKYRAMAMGIEFAGGPLGAVFVAPCMNLLIEEYALHGALLIYGGMLLHTCAGALVYRKGSWFGTAATEQSTSKISKVESTATILSEIEDDFETSNTNGGISFVRTSEFEVPKDVGSVQVLSVSARPSFVIELEVNKPYEKSKNDFCEYNMASVETTVEASGLCYNMNGRLSFFKELRYWLVNISNFSMVMGFPMVLTMLPDYTKLEIDPTISMSQSSLLLIAFNISDLVGRISFGLLADRKLFKRKHGFMATLLIAGVIAALFPMARSFNSVLACTGAYGLILGASSICPAVILNDAIGVVRFPVAYGTVITFSSLAIFLTGPILGGIFESTGSYQNCFYVLSVVLILGAIVWILEPIERYWSEKQRKSKTAEQQKEVYRF